MRSVRKLPDTTFRLTGLPQQGRAYNTHVSAELLEKTHTRLELGQTI